MDFAQTLDPFKCLIVHTILSFLTSAFTAPSYNLPISLFGHYALEQAEAIQSLQLFVGLLAGSGVFDIVFMHEMNGMIRFLTILILLVKVHPHRICMLDDPRQRGAQFSGLGNIRGDLGGPTVWSMPGGFTSGGRDGYQSVDEEAAPFDRPHAPNRPTPIRSPAPPQAPQTHQQPSAATPAAAPGAYQSV
ncbi:hypothetical protein DL96DRAFT_1702716 [Flagelloscypha sp. PMI_526]|nr:hypothetical protein DL96DRAFT_1702716 [Flagelloscypha sp. PMI_526]